METSRPQLNYQELNQLRWLLGGLLALLSGWTVLYIGVAADVHLMVLTLLVPIVIWKPALTLKIPDWSDRVAFPVIVTFFALDAFGTRQPLPSIIRLGLMLLIYRSISWRDKRHDLQLILLCLFLLVVAGVITLSMLFAFQILLFTACALSLLMVMNMIQASDRGHTGNSRAHSDWTQVNWRLFLGRLYESIDWKVGLFSIGLFLGMVGASTVLFLMIPRFNLESSFFLDQLIKRSSQTGFSETVRFGDVSNIAQNTNVAFNVDISRPEVVSDMPYWRMLTLDEHFPEGFRMSMRMRGLLRRSQQRVMGLPGWSVNDVNPVVLTVYLQPGISRFLPLMGEFGAINFDEPKSLQFNRRTQVMALEKDPARMMPYQMVGLNDTRILRDDWFTQIWNERPVDSSEPVTSTSGEDTESIDAEEPPELILSDSPMGRRRRNFDPYYVKLHLDSGDEDTLAKWVQEIGPPLGGDVADYVQRATHWLQQRHEYSLQSNFTNAPGSDPLIRWMNTKEPGHCELFAGSMILLAREAGIPARMVTGFKGGTWNPGSKSITVRNSDAHAWCEIYNLKDSWMRVDPTPGANLLGTPPAPRNPSLTQPVLAVETGWDAKMNSLRVFWYRRVVNFSQASQEGMAKLVKEALKEMVADWNETLTAKIKSIRDWFAEPWSSIRAGYTVGSLFFLMALAWLWRGLGLGMRLRMHRGRDPMRREAGKWLKAIRGMTTTEEDPARSETEASLLRLRYGPKVKSSEAISTFQRARKLVRRDLRRRIFRTKT